MLVLVHVFYFTQMCCTCVCEYFAYPTILVIKVVAATTVQAFISAANTIGFNYFSFCDNRTSRLQSIFFSFAFFE